MKLYRHEGRVEAYITFLGRTPKIRIGVLLGDRCILARTLNNHAGHTLIERITIEKLTCNRKFTRVFDVPDFSPRRLRGRLERATYIRRATFSIAADGTLPFDIDIAAFSQI